MVGIKHLSVRSGDFSLDDISFEIEAGECLALMGASGAGKSTIVEAICGLRSVNDGGIWIDKVEVTDLAPAQRSVGLVPQDNALFPSMTVEEQITYGPRVRKWNAARVEAKILELSEPLQIAHLLKRNVHQLSGGEAKRVAIARALAYEPKLLCLDESFTGLDETTRNIVMDSVQWAVRKYSLCALLITHQRVEAEQFASRVLKLEGGRLV